MSDLTDYQRGYLDGVLAYSFRKKDGEVYVGNTGITYQQAVRRFLGPGYSVEFPEHPGTSEDSIIVQDEPYNALHRAREFS